MPSASSSPVFRWARLIAHVHFATALPGFGWSDKAIVSYEDYSIWQRQLRDFVRDVVK